MQVILETSKRNPYRLPLVGVEEGHRLEAEQLRHDQVGEGLDIRVGLELRVALLQQQQLLQALAERALVAEALGERSGAGGARAQLGHAREQRLFVGGIAAHGLDQLRHQVGAALELHVDVGEALPGEIAIADQAVIEKNPRQKKNDDKR